MKRLRRFTTVIVATVMLASLSGILIGRTTIVAAARSSNGDAGSDSPWSGAVYPAVPTPTEPVPLEPGPSEPVAPAPDAPEQSLPEADPPLGEEESSAPEPPVDPISLGEPIYRFPNVGRQIFLTFDDGPSRQTQAILDILQSENIPAAFFWIASQAGVEMALEVVAQGHQLGTHTMTHADLTTLNPQEQAAELAGSSSILDAAIQGHVAYFRPPYGAWTETTLRVAAELGLTTLMWDADSRDWALGSDPDQIIANVLREVREGSVILLHERPQTVQVLPQLIQALREQGYSFGRLP